MYNAGGTGAVMTGGNMKSLIMFVAAGFSCVALAQGAFQIGVNVEGKARVAKEAGPVYVEFAGSRTATAAVADDLRRHGYVIASERGHATQALLLSGKYSVQSSLGKRHVDNITTVIDAPKVKVAVQSHETGVNSAPPPVADGSKMPAAAGSPVFGDLGEHSRGYATKLAGLGIGAAAAKCPMEGCKTPELLKQSAVISIAVESKVGIERSEVTASTTTEAVVADLLIMRAANVAMAMAKGQK